MLAHFTWGPQPNLDHIQLLVPTLPQELQDAILLEVFKAPAFALGESSSTVRVIVQIR